uniref:Putative secreted protein n=1 Tax=Ixodes ricinus TaxID=34613 RepID=A0A6B0UDW6_IXORI
MQAVDFLFQLLLLYESCLQLVFVGHLLTFQPVNCRLQLTHHCPIVSTLNFHLAESCLELLSVELEQLAVVPRGTVPAWPHTCLCLFHLLNLLLKLHSALANHFQKQ